MMMLNEAECESIKKILNHHLPPDAQVLVFGSRATGSARVASDLDLLICNKEPKFETFCRLKDDFEFSNLPFCVDVVLESHVSQRFLDSIKANAIDLKFRGKNVG